MLAEYVKKHPDHTLMEMKQNLGFGISSIWYRLKQLKITLKKVTLYRENAKIDNSSIIYIDEAGVDNRLYLEYGRAQKGEKIYADIPSKKGQRISIIGGWIRKKFIAPLTFTGGCDKEVFNTWLEQILLPKLPLGTTIIMENAAFHKTTKTKELIECAGCHLLYLQHIHLV